MLISPKQATILSILASSGEEYGWKIVELDESGMLNKSSIYIELSRLVDKGFLDPRKEMSVEGERGLPKRFYKLNGLGANALAAYELFHSMRNAGLAHV